MFEISYNDSESHDAECDQPTILQSSQPVEVYDNHLVVIGEVVSVQCQIVRF